MKEQLKKLILLMLIGSTFVGCSLEEDLIKKEQDNNKSIPVVKTVPYEEAGETFRLLKNNFKIEPYLKSRFQSNFQARTTTQTSGLTIVTDVVKEVTLGNYTSYTMEVISQQDSLVFYNLTMEYKNGESSMFITKYTPTEFWLNNKNESFQGNISSARLNLLTQYTEPEELFDNDLGNNNHDLGVGPGGGGNYSPQGSPYYPTNCGGIVIVSIKEVPYQCGCGDWPWQNCSGCNTNSPYSPGYHQIPYYICQNYGYGNNNPPSNTGGFNGGGPSSPSSGSDTSIAGMIKPEECTERITGDLNGDCLLSPYEMCILNGYSIEVCECISANNGTLSDCISDNNCNKLTDMLDPDKQNLNLYINDLVTKHQQGQKNEVSYSFRKTPQYDPATDDYTAFGNYNAIYKEGGPTMVKINIGTLWYSSIHLHPKDQEAAAGIFSWLDIRTLKDAYDELTSVMKSEVSMTILAPNPLNLNDYNVYTLKIKDVNALSQALNNEWNSPKWNGITDEQEKIKAIQRDLGGDYVANKNNLAQFFLQKFSNYGLSLYQLENNQWKELVINNSTNQLELKPCNN
jgi:hypothetical protein